MMTRTRVLHGARRLRGAADRAFNDVDFCLRVRQAGYEVVYTPYAELYHYESASRGRCTHRPTRAFFCGRWASRGHRDPFYNPNLDLGRPYRISVDDWH